MDAAAADASGGKIRSDPALPAADWLAARRNLRFPDYQALWQWSVDDLSGFWGAWLEYLDLPYDGDASTVLADASMPGATWFPDVRLNYAEAMLRLPGRVRTAVVMAFVWGLWHVPLFYNATLENELIHALQHQFFLVAGFLFPELVTGKTQYLNLAIKFLVKSFESLVLRSKAALTGDVHDEKKLSLVLRKRNIFSVNIFD